MGRTGIPLMGKTNVTGKVSAITAGRKRQGLCSGLMYRDQPAASQFSIGAGDDGHCPHRANVVLRELLWRDE